jgi:hypothetical protein
MSDQDWSKQAFFDAPIARQELERLKLERPAGAEAQRIVSPPVQAPVQEDLRAILANPQLAEQLWHDVDSVSAPSVSRAEQPSDAEAVIQVGLALYVLHALHSQDKPGFQHLSEPPDDDEDELGVQRT